MKKLASILLVLVLSLALLAGCSGSASSSQPASSTGGTASTSAPAASTADSSTPSGGALAPLKNYSADDPYKLTFAYLEFYEQDDAARQAVQDALNEMMVEKYFIEVDLLPLSIADYQTSVQLMLSGGDALDVMPIHYSYAASWINMNGIYDMNEFMDTTEGQAIVDALGGKLAYAGSMNGILYGFPANKEYVELGGLCMRADICDELGITEEYGLELNNDEYSGVIYDWSAAGEIFEKVKAAYPNMDTVYMGASSQMNRFTHFDQLSDSLGVVDWDADPTSTTVVNKFETDTYRKAITMLADWYDKGYVHKDAQTATAAGQTQMKAGNTFSFITSIKPGFLVEAKAATGYDCYTMYFGEGTESSDGVRSVLHTSNANLYNTGIATNSEDPAMAFKFINALYTDSELMNFWQYGIEDVHYQVQDDGTAYYVDGEDGSNYAYHQNTGWSMGNQFVSYVWNDGSKTADYWNKLANHNAWGDYSGTFGFMWDSTQYSTELTALTNALNTYRAALETGSVGSADLDATLQQLNDDLYAAGLQTVIDAKQAQLDAWLASQG